MEQLVRQLFWHITNNIFNTKERRKKIIIKTIRRDDYKIKGANRNCGKRII